MVAIPRPPLHRPPNRCGRAGVQCESVLSVFSSLIALLSVPQSGGHSSMAPNAEGLFFQCGSDRLLFRSSVDVFGLFGGGESGGSLRSRPPTGDPPIEGECSLVSSCSTHFFPDSVLDGSSEEFGRGESRPTSGFGRPLRRLRAAAGGAGVRGGGRSELQARHEVGRNAGVAARRRAPLRSGLSVDQPTKMIPHSFLLIVAMNTRFELE